MKCPSAEELKQLSPDLRLQLIEQVWDSLSAESVDLPLPPAHAEELDRRMIERERSPQSHDRWANVRARVSSRTA